MSSHVGSSELADTFLTRVGWFITPACCLKQSIAKSLHLLPRSGAYLSSLACLRVSCIHTQALKMTRFAAVGVSRTGMNGNKTCRKLHSRRIRPARRMTPRTSGIGLQHEVIAAHSSRWPFRSELVGECKSPGTRPDRG